MDEDIFARVETRPEAVADRWPFCLEFGARRTHIGDWQVQPFHSPTLNFRTELRDGELRQLVRLQECDDRLGTPSDDRAQVLFKIPCPGSSNCESIVLSRSKGNADFSSIGAEVDCGDLQRIGLTGSYHFTCSLFANALD
jgi:hypothetical protein